MIEDTTSLNDAADNNIIDLDSDPISDDDDLSFHSTYSYTDIYTHSIPTTSNIELDGIK